MNERRKCHCHVNTVSICCHRDELPGPGLQGGGRITAFRFGISIVNGSDESSKIVC